MSITALFLTLQSFWSSNGVYIMTILFALSESLASVPQIKSNSMCQLILNIITSIKKVKK